MRLSVVIPILNQTELAMSVVKELIKNTSEDVEILLINNGGDKKIEPFGKINVVNNDKSIGVYPTFKQGFENTRGDIVAFFHSDFIVWERGWDIKVIEAFDFRSKLGMIGFIGSNEIDTAGGRGLGTTSNFQGKKLISILNETKSWTGSPAEPHGKRNDGFTNAAVVDGCAMIIRRRAWQEIGVKENFPPHHFYDRLISTQLLEKGWDIGVLGIACDHISGQTVNQEPKYQKMAWEWLRTHGGAVNDFDDRFNYDHPMYLMAERKWLEEYRSKGFIPFKVNI